MSTLDLKFPYQKSLKFAYKAYFNPKLKNLNNSQKIFFVIPSLNYIILISKEISF